MPRFHFHLHNSVEAHDEEGAEFPDLDTARLSAVTNARDLMGHELRKIGRICLSHSIEIADPEGLQLHVVRYGDCVEILP